MGQGAEQMGGPGIQPEVRKEAGDTDVERMSE